MQVRTFHSRVLLIWGTDSQAGSGGLAESFDVCERMARVSGEVKDNQAAQAWLGNLALILNAWGRLFEALALLKQKEAICLELGNRTSLGYCYWNLGLLALELGDIEEEQLKLNAAIALFTELQMRRQRDAVAAELAETLRRLNLAFAAPP